MLSLETSLKLFKGIVSNSLYKQIVCLKFRKKLFLKIAFTTLRLYFFYELITILHTSICKNVYLLKCLIFAKKITYYCSLKITNLLNNIYS